VKFVLHGNVAVCFDPGGAAAAVWVGCRDAVRLSGVLVNPLSLEPFARVDFVRPYQMKPLRIGADGLTQLRYVARQQEIERLDLVGILLVAIQICEWRK